MRVKLLEVNRAPLGGGCRAVRTVTTAGRAVVKAVREDVPPHRLVADYVGCHLSQILGASVPQPYIVEVGPTEARAWGRDGGVVPVPAFGTEEVPNLSRWHGDPGALRRVVNPEAMTQLIAIDTWLLNADRFQLRGLSEPRLPDPHHHNVMFAPTANGRLTMLALDFSDAFMGNILSVMDQFTPELEILFGHFREWRSYVTRDSVASVCAVLSDVTAIGVDAVLQEVPKEWNVNAHNRHEIASWIYRRAQCVAQSLARWLGPVYWGQSRIGDERGAL